MSTTELGDQLKATMATPRARRRGSGTAGASDSGRSQQTAATTSADSGTSTLGGFGQSLAQEVDNATAKWMKMISSTFLGESASASLFARRAPALTAAPHESATRRKGNMRELKIALVGGSAVVRSVVAV